MPNKASIGDELFRVSRYELSGSLHPQIVSPRKIRALPYDAEWKGTHNFKSAEGEFVVYSSPAFYDGDIGVIVDVGGRTATNEPFVQLTGMKKGRRWPSPAGAVFLAQSSKTLEIWGVRYGGLVKGRYIFEIIDQKDPKKFEVLQTVEIEPDSFIHGFMLKGIFVKGLSKDDGGVISYMIRDTRAKEN